MSGREPVQQQRAGDAAKACVPIGAFLDGTGWKLTLVSERQWRQSTEYTITQKHLPRDKNVSALLTVEGVWALTLQDRGEEKRDDVASTPPMVPSSWFGVGLLKPAWFVSGLGGLELSELLPRPSRKSFRLNEEELRLSCTASHASSYR